ncbi:hypothetical protein LguiB_005588 [Lonicera macranthoides]
MTSTQSSFVVHLGNHAQVPIISFTATNPYLSSLRSAYFVRATLNDSSQVQTITAFIQAFGWKNVVPIYADDDFGKELYMMTMQTRVFVLHMTYYLGSQVLNKAQELGMMTEGYIRIVSDGITNPLSLMGTSLVGYSKGAIALAMVIEKVGYMNNNFKKMNSPRNLVNLGSYLYRVLSSFIFNGLSGDFHTVNGQLQSSAFEIVNGIGESKSVPKGWVIPTNENKLKIGIPVKEGFNHFVNVIRDQKINSMSVTGFCIDVFEVVMEALPYVVPFEYIPYAKPDGSAAGSYDDYTASLTSTLTIKQLEPAFSSVDELMEKWEIVGYAKGSFIQGLLRKSNMSKLKEDKSRDELHIKFSKGEIGAAFGEIPYMKPFLAKHCSKYTMVRPTRNTIGFGFVFPKGSPLVLDVSKPVLSVTEGKKMEKIEKAWFGKKTNCPDPSTSMSSNSLGINSFWGLFVIVGVAASFAFIIFTSMLVYENKNILMRIHPKGIWKNFITSSRESGGTNTNSVLETTVRPNLINNEEATM